MKAAVGEVVRSECERCGVLVHWKVIDRGDRSDWEPLDAASGFVCEHWGDHHEATEKARLTKSRKASVGSVTAEVISQ
jgi:hypothetical protein